MVSELKKFFKEVSEWAQDLEMVFNETSNIAESIEQNAKVQKENETLQARLKEKDGIISEFMGHIELLLAPQDEACRFDHNGNCQEHSWFGLENNNCPVKEAKQTLARFKEKYRDEK